jgi:hypothetical protein
MAALPLAALLLPGAVHAAGPFDGTWKTKLDSIRIDRPPDVYELKDGVFRCPSCQPGYTVKADGTDQKVAGHSYYDSVAVLPLDAGSVRITDKLAGKAMYEMTLRVSADGKTLDVAFQDLSGAKAAAWKQVSTRVAPPAPGAHAISGSWKTSGIPGASDEGTVIAYHMTADGMQMHYNGLSYDARFDGKPVPTANDPGKTLVSLKRISENVVEETDTREGKVTDILRMTVAPDGKTMTVVDRDPAHDTTMSFTMVRQP